MRWLLLCIMVVVGFVRAQPVTVEAQAPVMEAPFSVSALFANYQPSIYQIRVINQATGQKTSIGSGFVVDDGHFLATNYHVVSDALRKDNHVLQAVDLNDEVSSLQLVGVDVIHDLALVKADKKLGQAFELGEIPKQGEEIYALGNPHDLGFVIVDGINNGLLRKTAQARILFSGSLNSGMSGGPTLTKDGKVIGVNVAYLREGNDISFVIPAMYLKDLLKQKDEGVTDMNVLMTQQLFADNQRYFEEALAQDWDLTTIGEYQVPLAVREDVKCWDSSPEADVDDLLALESVSCFNDRSTFISNNLTMGQFGYSYSYFYAREPILRARFYQLYSDYYRLSFSRRAQKDFGAFDCQSQFIEISGRTFKSTFCRQPSKDFVLDGQSIDDQRFVAAEIGQAQQGFMIDIGMNGVQTELGKRIIVALLEQITWQENEQSIKK